MLRTMVLWGARAATAAVAALGAYLVWLGGSALWMAAALLPWPWRAPAGFGGPAGLVAGG